jgi:hypothetical protein
VEKIALLCPVRGRPGHLESYAASIAATAAAPDRIQLVFYADADDPKLTEYRITEEQLRRRYPGIFEILFHYGDPVGTPRAINVMAAANPADVYMISNDDIAFVTPGWDRRIDEISARHPDGIFNAWFNEGIYGDKLSCFPFVGRRWVEALGYLAQVLFEHYVVDHWIHHLGGFVGRNFFCEDIRIEHRHRDAEAGGHRFIWETEGAAKRQMDRDNDVFRRSERYLRIDAGILKKVIAEYAEKSR